MKKLEVIIASFLVYLAFVFTYLIPVKKNRVSIISYFNSNLGLEFNDIVNHLEDDNIEIKANLHKFNSSLSGKFSYLFSFLYQTYLFNTSRVVLLDGNNFVYSKIKVKKGTSTIQLWHASGAIKKFGMQSERRYEIKPYDYVIVGSNYFKEVFATSLNTPIENVVPLGIAKSDYLFNDSYLSKKREDFYNRYPHLINKKIILYAPTFRGSGIEDMNSDLKIDKFRNSLSGEYELLVKVHPLVNKGLENIENNVSNEQLYTLLSISDYIISDYSALIFDAIALNKDVIMYLYDLDEYTNNRGLSIDIDEIDILKAYNEDELIQLINKNCSKDNNKIKEKYLEKMDGQSAKRISNFIVDLIKEDK
ncbi:MAG: CDP-glycerol glycerophosphotransferase family protein [Erysipelotrichales bacterium]